MPEPPKISISIIPSEAPKQLTFTKALAVAKSESGCFTSIFAESREQPNASSIFTLYIPDGKVLIPAAAVICPSDHVYINGGTPPLKLITVMDPSVSP